MKDREKVLNDILQNFLQTATEEEKREFYQIMSEKKNKKTNINNIAAQTAKSIQKQFNISNESIKHTTKNLVVQMIKQANPKISENELSMLVNKFLPGAKEENIWKKLPPEIIKSMIDNILLYSVGQLPKEELDALPENWMEQYVAIFPKQLTNLIKAFLRNEIELDKFHAAVNYIITNR